MRIIIGYIFIILSALFLLRFIYDYKAISATIGSVFMIIVGKSQLEDKTPMLLYFFGIVLEFLLAFFLIFFGFRKISK